MKITFFWVAIIFCGFSTLTATAQTWDLYREVTARFIASGTASIAWSAPVQTAISEMNRNANKTCHQKSYSVAFRVTKINIIDAGTFIAARSEFRCWRN